MFKGNFTVAITPFHNDEIDWDSFKNFIEWQVSQNIDGIVLCGTNSEVLTLSSEERLKTVLVAKDIIGNKIPVLVGVGLCSTLETLQFAKQTEQLQVDALLIVSPYYIKPDFKAIKQYYMDIASQVSLPIILYNNPKRTGVDIQANVVAEIAEISNVIGIKDASADIKRPLQHSMMINKEFCQLCGDDMHAVAFNANGGCGIISVAANFIPSLISEIQQLTFANDFHTALKKHQAIVPLIDSLFSESSPAPVKNALYQLGIIKTPDVRRPLINASSDCHRVLSEYVNQYKLRM